MRKQHTIQVLGVTNIESSSTGQACTLNNYWPGGPGRLVIRGLTVTGSAKLEDLGITVPFGQSHVVCELVPGMFMYTNSGEYSFDVPEGFIKLYVNVGVGDSFLLNDGIYLISC